MFLISFNGKVKVASATVALAEQLSITKHVYHVHAIHSWDFNVKIHIHNNVYVKHPFENLKHN